MVFRGDEPNAGLSIALGVQEVRPVDLVTAYGTLANGGKKTGHTTILSVDATGGRRRSTAVQPPGGQAGREPAGRLHRDRHPGRQHEPEHQPVLGQVRADRAGQGRRPATLKTGTNNDAKDLNAYGFIAPPTDGRSGRGRVRPRRRRLERQQRQHGRRVRSSRSTSRPTSGRASSRRSTKPGRSPTSSQPDGLVQAKIDPFTGLRARSGDSTIDEWFIAGTRAEERAARGRLRPAILDLPGIHEHSYRTG